MIYDLLLPIELPRQAWFFGSSNRPFSINDEIAFRFGSYEASIHQTRSRRYIIVRVKVRKEEATRTLTDVYRTLAWCAPRLDISIRPKRGEVKYIPSGKYADLDYVSFFPSGETPYVRHDDENYWIRFPSSSLSEALSSPPLSNEAIEKALRIFADVDFEATITSRYILLATILELLADTRPRDDEALKIISRWRTDAKDSARHDISEALKILEKESLGTAVVRLVTNSASAAGCSPEEIEMFGKSARNAYRKRSKLLHAGILVTQAELAELRKIVRMVLTGSTHGTAFTPIATKQWDAE